MDNELANNEKEDQVSDIHDDDADAVFEGWTEARATAIARKMGVELTDAHWRVIKFIRTHYANVGVARHTREYAKVLAKRFADEGGSRFLYQIFPGGPVKQSCAIAGVEMPADVNNKAYSTSL